MEIMLFRPDKFKEWYTCNYTLSDDLIPDNKVLCSIYVAVSTVLLILSIPCMTAILKLKLLDQSCYKIMFFIGVFDIMALISAGIVSGGFGFFHINYCQAPKLFFIIGIIVEAGWAAQTSASILLAINRCLVMTSHNFGNELFKGWRTWAFCCIPLVYGIYVMFIVNPLIFSPVIMTWTFNPHIGVYIDPDNRYVSLMPVINNFVVVIAVPLIYLIFLCIHKMQKNNITSKVKDDKKQRKVFYQVFLICFSTTSLATIYVIIQYIVFPSWVYHLSQCIWILYAGSPTIVYLTLNRRIRKTAFPMFSHFSETQKMSDLPEKLTSISLDDYALQRLERLQHQTRRLNDELKIETEFSNRIEREHTNLEKKLEKLIEQEMKRERTWHKNVELAVKIEKNSTETAVEIKQTEKKKVKRKVKKSKERQKS
uniref:Uncharacterized protein n=1 Tax=Panagrolaimus sp. PS1159 TaxID=55785 RepID=A0AC35GGU7_9BILA